MFDKTINVKTIDLSGVNLPSDDEATCDLIYSALSTTYGFPIYMENFKVNGVKHDSVLVNPIILENQTIINLNDCHLIVAPTEISVGNGMYGASLESIVDSHGNHRFVEGNFPVENINGITWTYHKWSLSGTHLMIVLAGKNDSETDITFAGNELFGSLQDIRLSYIYNKIFTLTTNNSVSTAMFRTYQNFTTIEKGNLSLAKPSANHLIIVNWNKAVKDIPANAAFRVQFDLLIDADYDE